LSNLKLAVIGCGAITKGIHLPVTALSDQVEVTVLVDKFLPRAHELADKYGVPAVADDYRDVIGQVDAAIVALPNYLHAPVTLDLLRSGIHVLVEKPMALKTSECDEMIEAARNTGAVLAVGLVRRFYESSQSVKKIIENGLLGNILGFDCREGIIYRWAVASGAMFRKETAGGGVFVDMGIHVLDLLLWWLGDYDSVEYYDDAMGGVEADCELYLQLQCGASGVVELSRTRNLRNSWIIRGERGTLEVEKGLNPLIHLETKNQGVVLTGQVTRDDAADKDLRDVFRRQLDDFADAILSHRQPFVPGQEGKRAVELIETCYASRQSLKQPWMFPERPGYGVLEGALP
jgi:predicted dehydrogenase